MSNLLVIVVLKSAFSSLWCSRYEYAPMVHSQQRVSNILFTTCSTAGGRRQTEEEQKKKKSEARFLNILGTS